MNAAKTDEVMVLEAAVKSISDQFNAFIGACLDKDGKPVAPATKDLMRVRACLPARCLHAFKSKS